MLSTSIVQALASYPTTCSNSFISWFNWILAPNLTTNRVSLNCRLLLFNGCVSLGYHDEL
jgi:hypothetical protein